MRVKAHIRLLGCSLSTLLAALVGCAQVPRPGTLEIMTFSGTPNPAGVNTMVTLSWQSRGAASCALGDSVSVSLEPNTCAAGSHDVSFEAPGTYPVSLEATAADGTRTTRTITLEVTNEPISTPSFQTTTDGLSVTFTASPIGASLYTWDFGDGSTGTGETLTHLYEGPGDYSVRLEVTSGAGTQEVTQTVNVGNTRITLFGSDLQAWVRKNGGDANWRLGNDGSPYFEVLPGGSVGSNDIETREAFGDFRLHLEFWVPQTPASSPEQTRGNSGVYLQGRYEIQILDSYAHPLSGMNDAGAIYELKDAESNASRPAETWQSYDIVFRAARYSGGTKTENARVSVSWNGQLVQDDVVIPGPTRLGDEEAGDQGILSGPIRLQDHGYGVRYRNIWLEPL